MFSAWNKERIGIRTLSPERHMGCNFGGWDRVTMCRMFYIPCTQDRRAHSSSYIHTLRLVFILDQ